MKIAGIIIGIIGVILILLLIAIFYHDAKVSTSAKQFGDATVVSIRNLMYFTEQIINYSEKSNDNFLCKISKIGSVQFDLLGLTRKLCPIQQIMKTDYPEDYWCVIGEKTKKGSYSRIDFMQKDHALIVSNPFMGVKGKLNGSNVVFGERNCSFISDNNVVKVIRGLPLHLEDSLNYVETSEGYITLEIPAGTDERLNPNKADVFLIQSLFRKQSPAP